MRTTVTLDPDVEIKVRQLARERGISFKVALNDALRAGLRSDPAGEAPYRVPVHDLALLPGINLDRALALADELEDVELVRRLQLRK